MIYTLTGGGMTARIDSLGAQLLSLVDTEGCERIWQGDPAYWAGHAPVLFPIVGALREGRARIDGTWVEMGQHGFARSRAFSLLEQTDASVTLRLSADEETRRMYPFSFVLTVRYTLLEDGYSTEFTVENAGDEGEMPFAIGGHPGFCLPMGEDAPFEAYELRFPEEEHQRCPAVVSEQALIDPSGETFRLEGRVIPLRHELFRQDALIFEGLRSPSVRIINPASGRGVEMDYTGFPLLGVWSAKNDGPYVCLEPCTGCATRTDEGDDFRRKKGMRSLPPGGTERFRFTVRLLTGR